MGVEWGDERLACDEVLRGDEANSDAVDDPCVNGDVSRYMPRPASDNVGSRGGNAADAEGTAAGTGSKDEGGRGASREGS